MTHETRSSGSVRKVLVTGANGFIGRHVCRRFSEAGFMVHGTGRKPWPENARRAWGVSNWTETGRTPDTLEEAVAGADAVVHCAGSATVGQAQSRPFESFGDTVGTTAALLDAVRRHAPEARTVFLSSAAVYGEAESVPIPETAPLSPVSLYGRYKRMAEDLCRAFGAQFGLPVVVLRLFSVYGPGLEKQLLWDACRKLDRGEGRFFGTGNELRDWLHVRDAADLVYHVTAAASPACPAINGGSGDGAAVSQVLRGLSDHLGAGSPPRFDGRERPGDPKRLVADAALAKSMGWAPRVRLEEGLGEYVRWYRERVKT